MSSNSRDMYVHVFYTLMQENLTPCTKKIVKPGVCFNNGFIHSLSCSRRNRDGWRSSPPRFSSPFLRLRRQMLRMGHCRRSKPPSFLLSFPTLALCPPSVSPATVFLLHFAPHSCRRRRTRVHLLRTFLPLCRGTQTGDKSTWPSKTQKNVMMQKI